MSDEQLSNQRFWQETSPQAVRAKLAAGGNIAATDHAGRTPLHIAAAENKQAAIVAILLDAGAEIEARDNVKRTPLHWAAAVDAVPVVEILLERGADIEARTIDGQTPLHRAVTNRTAVRTTVVLLDRGANIEAEDEDGRRPLHTAAEFNNFYPDVIKTLLERGANASAISGAGLTAYQIAVEHDAEAEVLRLLSC